MIELMDTEITDSQESYSRTTEIKKVEGSIVKIHQKYNNTFHSSRIYCSIMH